MSSLFSSQRALIAGAAAALLASGSAMAQIQVADLTDQFGAADDRFGSSVALDGDYLAVGSPTDDNPNSNIGSVTIYERTGATSWGNPQKIVHPMLDQRNEDQFGHSVALDADTLVVGVPFFDGVTFMNQGAAYVYVRNAVTGLWDLQQRLTVNDGTQTDDRFGWSVAVDGNTIVVGAPRKDVSLSDAGRAYVFFRTGSTWALQATINTTGGTASGNFGWSVGVSGDDALIGAPNENGTRGRAYFYRRTGSSWGAATQVIPDAASIGTDMQFGWSVAVSGTRALIGCPREDTMLANAGGVRPFTFSGSWVGGAHFFGTNRLADDRFGQALAMKGDIAAIGAPLRDGAFADAGRFELFEFIVASWSSIGTGTNNPAPGANSEFYGSAVAAEGSFAFVGTPGDAGNTGRVYGYRRPSACEGQTLNVNFRMPTAGSSLGGTPVSIGGTGGISPDTLVTFTRGDFSITVGLTGWTNCTTAQLTMPAFPPPCDCAGPVGFTVDARFENTQGTFNFPNFFTYTTFRTIVNPGESIQMAVDGAAPGTCVVINPGIYTQNVVIDDADDGLTITSTNLAQPNLTRIRGGTSLTPPNPTFQFVTGVTQTSLCGLNIVLGNAGVQVLTGAQAFLYQNRIENNNRTGNGGGVLVNGAGAFALLVDNAIVLNSASAGGGGISVEADASAIIRGNRVTTNIADSGPGGAIRVDNALAQISTNDLLDNRSDGAGAGISINAPSGSMIVENNLVSNNRSTTGNGASVNFTDVAGSTSVLSFIFNDLSGNIADNGSGGGIFLGPDTMSDITLNRMVGNDISADGGGVYCTGNSVPYIQNNLIQANLSPNCDAEGGGVYVGQFNLAEVRDNIIKDNLSQLGGGLICLLKSEPYIYRNIFAFNEQGSYCSPGCGPAYGPGILVGRESSAGAEPPVGPAPIIINNTLYRNESLGLCMVGRDDRPMADVGTGSIHGLRIGLFQPNWINNILSQGIATRWGITSDERRNTGTRIDFNLFEVNNPTGTPNDSIDPFCNIAGLPPFINNRQGNPMFRDPTNCDFTLPLTATVARTAGEGGVDAGAVWDDAVIGPAGGTVSDISDTSPLNFASKTQLVVPVNGFSTNTEVFAQIAHLPREFNTAPTVVLSAATAFAQFLTLPGTGVVGAGGAQVKLQTRVSTKPGTSLRLYRFNFTTGFFENTTINGVVDATGTIATFPNVAALLHTPSNRPYIFVGSDIGADCDIDGVPDHIAIQLLQVADVNRDLIPDICQQIACIADIDQDGFVGVVDLGLVITDMGETSGEESIMVCDLDSNGVVDFADIAVIIIAWGPCRRFDVPADPL